MRKPGPSTQPTESLALAGVAGQAGCITLAVVLVALVAGLWLDRQLGSKYVVTIVLIMASVPVSLYLMIRTVLRSMERYHEQRGHQRVTSGAQPIGGIWREPGSSPGRAADDEDEDEDEGAGPAGPGARPV